MMAESTWLFTMADLRKAVRILAAFVADERAKPTPAITDALNIYTSACQIVNDRLVECNRLVWLGHRSEALRQVQIEPDALDMWKELQFKNREWLTEKCEDFALPLPPRLETNAAKSMNEAYSLEQTQQSLLQEHRFLALSRAPIRQRIYVLRLIQKESNREVFWQDDLATYEQKRIDEIRKLMAESRDDENWDIIQDLYQESMRSSISRTPFPLDLMDQINKARKRLMEDAAYEELQPLLDQLASAIALKQIVYVKKLLNQIDPIVQKYQLSGSGSVMAQIEGARKWHTQSKVDQKRRKSFLNAVESLRSALNDGVEWDFVQLYYDNAMGYDWSLPEDVADEFRRRAKKRQQMQIFMGIAGLIVVLIAILFFRYKF